MANFAAALNGKRQTEPTDGKPPVKGWLRGSTKPRPGVPGARYFNPTDADRSYARGTLERLAGEVAMAPVGQRNHEWLNPNALRAYRVADACGLDRQIVTDRMMEAGRRCGLPDAEVESTLKSARNGADKYGPAPRDPDKDDPLGNTTFDPNGSAANNPGANDAPLYTDFAALLSGGLPEPPKPTVLPRDDGTAVFYRRKRNDLHGDPEDGKTMVALAAAAEELNNSGNVLFLDFDNNGPAEAAQRLIMLGANPSVLADRNRFRHIEPADADEVLRVVDNCAGWATLVIGDCVGELMPLFRASSDSADDYTRVMQMVSTPLEHGGAAVIWLDHQAKSAESRNYGAGGTMAKRRAVSGVSINLVRKQTFTPGRGGMAEFWINKDRPGGLRAHCPRAEGRRQFAGTFILDPADPETGVAQWRVTPDRTEVPAESIDPVVERHHQAVVALGEDVATVAEVSARANGLPPGTRPTRSQKETARRSLERLVEQGRLAVVPDTSPKRWKAVA